MSDEELRNLDAQVAVDVMGGTNVHDADGYNHWTWDEPDGWNDFHGAHYSSDCLPFFTTDIAAAWKVVEKMHQMTEWRLHLEWSNSRSAWWVRVGLCTHFSAENAPLAICLAALEAVRVAKAG